jgi:RNA polymerase sigma-70 factor (ECF subfamily)
MKSDVEGRPREEELVERARRGDGDAFGELVLAHQRIAFRTAYLLLGNSADAEDAAQVGFVKAWQALPRFRRGAPFRPWLLAIVANEAKNRLRAGGRRAGLLERAAVETGVSGDAAPSPENELERGEQRARLRAALGTLNDDQRLTVGLRYLLDLDEAEVAAILGVRRGTVKSRIARALERLREEVPA